MKKSLLLIIYILFYTSTFAQSKSEIALFYGRSAGPAIVSIIRNGSPKGAPSSSLRDNNSIGIRYFTGINNNPKLKIETGIDYLAGKLEIKPAMTGNPVQDASHIEDFKLVTLPFYLNHSFGKYFYINEGIMLDYQKATSDTFTGFGVGIGFGIGGKYECKNFSFYINPKIERHLFLSEKYGLIELGIMVGVGYKF